jgi:hypothetical protein
LDWNEDSIMILDEALDSYRKEQVRAVIFDPVKLEIHDFFGVISVGAELLWLSWIEWYNGTYKFTTESLLAMSFSIE